jgi:GNAT superfamily N-acetyltransferase
MIHPAGAPRSPVEIGYLADHPEVLGCLAAGFKAQWANHFADQPIEAIKMGFAKCCREQGLPLALVALVDQSFAGTVSLRQESGTVCPGVGPWLTHLYVDPGHRHRGIGRSLIRAVEAEAVRHGFAALHAATTRAQAVFEHAGWKVIEVVDHQGDRVSVLRKSLDAEPRLNQ